jgi:hypothetical protein
MLGQVGIQVGAGQDPSSPARRKRAARKKVIPVSLERQDWHMRDRPPLKSL